MRRTLYPIQRKLKQRGNVYEAMDDRDRKSKKAGR